MATSEVPIDVNFGWIKLYRKIKDHPRRKDPEWLSVWVEIMTSATHQPIDMTFSGQRITLKPGQLITSRKSLARESGVSESKVERVLKWMENEHQIEQLGSSTSRLITILNWIEHQQTEHPFEQHSNSDRTATEQPSDTNKNIRTEECKKNNNRVFVKPSMEELREKCSEIELPEGEGESFFHYYESNGWRVGKNPMKSWESALQNWKKNFIKRGPDLFNSHEKHHANNRPCADRNKGTFNEGKASQYDELSSP